MFKLEYAANRNGRFAGWLPGGNFPTREAAEAEAKSRGLHRLGDDHLIGEYAEVYMSGGYCLVEKGSQA